MNTDLVWEVRDTNNTICAFHGPRCEAVPYEVAEEVHIPFEFETDLASVPRFLWPIIATHGLHTQAAVLHDYLYRTPQDRRGSWSRRWCDTQFYDAMVVLGTSKLRARIMHFAVRAMGRRAYRLTPSI